MIILKTRPFKQARKKFTVLKREVRQLIHVIITLMPRFPQWIARHWVIVLALALYLPLAFLGYGSDVDTFRVLDSGRNFLATADYVPSRRPGFLVHEISTFALDQLGGSLLSNLGTLFWAAAGLLSFQRICRRYDVPQANLLTLLLMVQPVFWFNATVTGDYVWALGLLLIGFDLLGQERYAWAGLALGLAVGCRITSVVVVVPLLVFAWFTVPHKRWQVAAGGLFAALLAGAAYILPWDFAEWRPSFWAVSLGSADLWSSQMQLGRYVYKNLYLWGFPAALFLPVLLVAAVRGFSKWKQPGALRLVGLCALVIAGCQALFFRYPIEVEYLLPTLPFWLLLFGLTVRQKKPLVILLALVMLYNFININIARPDTPSQAREARYGLWLEPGYLVRETSSRLALLGCDSHACYDERIARRVGK